MKSLIMSLTGLVVVSANRVARVLLSGLAVVVGCSGLAAAGPLYWTGLQDGNWNTGGGGTAATNWSTSPYSVSDPEVLPGSSADVYFASVPAYNLTTTLGQAFSIQGLIFTNNAVSPVTIGGSNTLTIGGDGVTIQTGSAAHVVNAALALGAGQTWTNLNPSGSGVFTVNGAISGSAPLTLAGGGGFVWGGANGLSSALTLNTNGTSLSIGGSSGQGSAQNVTSVTLGGGTSLYLDSSGGSLATSRLASTAAVTLAGGTLQVNGYAGAATAETIGSVAVNSGGNTINLNPGAGGSATLTIAGAAPFSRSPGGTLNFANTGSIVSVPNMSAGFIGPWATIGSENNGGSLDWATVNASHQIVPMPAASYTTTTTPGTWTSASDVKLSALATLSGATTAHTLYVTGGGTMSLSGDTLTLAGGGILAYGGGGSYALSGSGMPTISNAVLIGNNVFTGHARSGAVTVATGVPDLVINASCNLAMNVTNIVNAPNPASLTVSTTSGSTTVTVLNSGSTAQLCPGTTVTATGLPTGDTIASVIDSTHFTVSSAATASTGSTTLTATSNTGLTKTGAGILDLSADNTVTGSFTFTGPTVVNGGLVLVNSDAELGAAPSSFNAAAIVLNGGGIETTSTAIWNLNRGITVGPQGGTLSWASTNTIAIYWKTSITGPGGMTFSVSPYNYNGKTTGGTLALDLTGSQALSYQGGTTLNATTNSVIQWTSGLGTSSQQLPVGTAVTLSGGGTVNLGGYSQTIGSLASAAGVGTITNIGALTLGGAAGSPVNQTASYGGTLTGNGGVVMNGLGTQTFGGANTYTGGTTINAGGLLINGALASTANTVTVASGALLGGSGSIAGSVNFSAGSILAPAGSPTGYSHLTVTNSVAIAGGSFFDFNLAGSGSTMNNDQLLVTGTGNTLTLSGSTDTLNLVATSLAGYTGSYPLSLVLLKAPSLTDSVPQSGWTINAPGGYNMQVVGPNDTTSAGSPINGVAGELILYVGAPTLKWTGANSGNWDFSTANWPAIVNGGLYRDGLDVLFDDSTAGRNTTVTITPASVSPNLVTFNNSAYNYTLNGVVAGNGGLNKQGSGVVTLNGTETYSGGTTISAGTLNVNGGLSASTTVQALGGTLAFNNASQTLAGLNGSSGGTVTINPTLLSVAGGSFGGTLTGTGGLNVTGPLALTNTGNTYAYTGGTTVASGGNLSVAAGSMPGASSSRITLSGGTLSVTLSGTTTVGSGLTAQFGNLPSATTAEQPYFTSVANIQARITGLSASGGNGGTFPTTANGQTNLDFSNGGTYNGNNPFATLGYAGNGGFGATFYDVLMSGSINITQTGVYSFATTSDDGSMLFIDGQTVVNNNNYQGPTTRTGSTSLTPGLHQIAIGYYQGNGGNGLLVQYEAPGGAWATVPNTVLAGPVAVANPYNNPVTLTANSTLDVQPGVVTGGFATYGPLTLNTGRTLTTSGTAAGVSFTGTTLAGGAGSYGFTVNGRELMPGPFTTSGAATIAVGGSGVLTLTPTSGSQLAGSQFQINNGGTLLAVGQNTLQGASIAMSNGGTLMLAATAANAAYDIMLPTSPNPVTLPASGMATVLAGAGFAAGGLPGAVLAGANISATTVTLASTGTLSVGSGQTLGLGSLYNYTLAVGPSLVLSASGGGTILATTGTAMIGSVYSSAADNLAVTSGATLALSASNTMTGTLGVTGGSFIASNPASFGTATLKFNGGTIGALANNLTGASAIANPIAWGGNPSVNIGGSAKIEFNQPLSLPGTGAYSISDSGGYGTFSGVISGPGGLNLNGYPTLSNSNTYSGGTTFNANANVTVTSNQAFGSGPLLFNDGGFQSAQPLTGALAVTNAWSIPNGGTAYFSSTNTIEMIQGTALTGNVVFNVTYNANGQVGRLQVDGAISDGGHGYGLWKGGGGILTLASTGSTYSGGTYLNYGTGTIDVPVSSAGPAGNPNSGPLGTGTVTINNNYYYGNANINVGNYSGTAAVTIGNALNIAGPCGYDGGSYGITFSGPVALIPNFYNANQPAVLYTAHNVTFSGNISGNGQGLYLATGSNWNTVEPNGGVVTLSGNNTFDTGVTISQGTLVAASPTALGLSSNPVTLNDGNTNNNNDQSTALLIGGPFTVPNAINATNNGNGTTYLGGNTANSSAFSGAIALGKTATLVAASGGTATFANAISGAGGVVVGAAPGAVNYNGTVVLGGSNTYTGGTAVNYGTLALAGSGAIAGPVTVYAGATLGGGGTGGIAGPVTVSSGGVLSPSPAAPLTISNVLTMADGSVFALTASGGSVSAANVASLAVLGTANLQINVLDAGTLAGGRHTFLNWSSSGPAPGTQNNWNVVSAANATWAGGSAGNWDTTANWSGYEVSGGTVVAVGTSNGPGALQLQGATTSLFSATGPTPASNAFIQQAGGANVNGPAADTTIAGLTLGSTAGSANTLTLGTGALYVTGAAGATINPTGYLNLGGGSLWTTALALSAGGLVNVGSGGNLLVPGAVTVAGNLTANGAPGAAATVDNSNGSLAVSGTAIFGAASNANLPSVTVSGAGQFTLAGGGLVGSLTASGTSTVTIAGGTLDALTLANGYSGSTTLGAAASGPASLTVSSGNVCLNNTNGMTNLTLSGGSVTTGPGVTAANVTINGVSALGTAVNTAGNFLSVTNSLNVVNSTANITVSGSSFAVKGANLAANIDTLQLSGGTTALNYQAGSLTAGLDIRAWQSGMGGASLDTYTGTAGANPPNMSYDPSSLAGKIGTSTDSTFKGTLNPMNIAINVPETIPQEWFQNGGMGTGSIAAPTGYLLNFTVEYRGKLYVPATGTYCFCTQSDDGSALWIDPGSNNPAYANALVQNDYGQGMSNGLANGTFGAVFSSGVTLTQGYHDILIRYNQGLGQDGMGVYWAPNVASGSTPPVSAYVLIPGSDFYHGSYAPAGAAMPNTNLLVTSASMFSPGSGYTNTFGSLTLGGNLTFSGGSAAGTSASFSGITATTTAAIGNDATTSDVTTVIVPSGGTVAVSNNQTLTFNAPAVFGTGGAGPVTVGSAGNAGTVVLASPAFLATHLLDGSLNVNAGTLLVNGTLAGSGSLTVGSSAILGGSGSIAGAGVTGVTIQSGGHLAPHVASTATSTLTIGSVATPSALTLAGGSILDFNMGAPGNTDMVQVNGALTLNSGTDTLNVNCLTGFTYGTYDLVGYTGSLTNNSPTWTVNASGRVPANAVFGLATPASGGPPGQITLTISSGTLTWTGQHGGNWNTTEADWSGSRTTYSDGAVVIFPSGATNTNISITAARVNPMSVIFTNTAGTHYVLGGGSISGAASLVVSGGGMVTLNNKNGYTAGTLVAAGSLLVNGSLGHTAVAVNGGATLGGTGSIGGSVTVAGGSSPGTRGTISLLDGAAGTLTLSDAIPTDTVLTIGGSTAGSLSLLDFEVGTSADRILIAAGKMVVNPGGGTINITPLAGFGPGTYDLMDFPSNQASGLSYLSLATTSVDGYTLSLQSTPTAEQLVVQTVPEPSTLALLGVGAVGLLGYALRRWRLPRRLVSMTALLISAAGVAGADVFNMPSGETSLQFVTVGNPGNAADTQVMNDFTTGYGAVGYTYQMGKYDVTVGQYCQFLNAVAKTDTYGLYYSGMATDMPTLGIQQNGTSGNYSYSVVGSYNQGVNCPIFDVPWGDAARFCNWLQNGQPTGPEGPGTTENGAYTLSGATSNAALMAVTRNANASYFIPSENEWYKAAYYDPTLHGGAGGYWAYPTKSGNMPSNALSSTGTNNANVYNGRYTDPTNYLTPVGYFAGSPGPYGTFDMGGDVWQWNEANVRGGRGMRGGPFNGMLYYLESPARYDASPAGEYSDIGFRVASLPGAFSINLSAPTSATIITGGTATLGTTVENLASSLGNNLNYTLVASVQSGSATLGPVTPASGSLAPSVRQPCTVSATSTSLGSDTISFTGSDPNSSNGSQTATATLTVMDHSNASLSPTANLTTQTINFGNVLRAATIPSQGFTICNRAANTSAAYTANLQLTGFTATGDPALTTNLSMFTELATGNGNTYTASLNTSNYTTAGINTVTMSASQLADDSPLPGAGNNNSGGMTVTLQGNVGNATADMSNSPSSFGSPLTAPVAQNASYANLESKVTTTTGVGGVGMVGSIATILAGTNGSGSSQTVSMEWRTQTLVERADSMLLSDIVRLGGMSLDGTGGQTSPFVLQMTYNPSLLFSGSGSEGLLASEGSIYLGYLDPSDGKWENAVLGNVGTNLGSFHLGAWPIGDMTLGDYGVNTSNHTVWAVLDHNSDFSVVPEPSNLALLGVGAVGLLGYTLRRKSVDA
jgi:autotransporter-associated beta strand protein